MLIQEKVLKAGGPYRGVVLYSRSVYANGPLDCKPDCPMGKHGESTMPRKLSLGAVHLVCHAKRGGVRKCDEMCDF